MKRKALISYLILHGCEFLREGSNHTIYINIENKSVSTLPRHKEINGYLVRKICKDLKIKNPFQKD